MAIFEAPSFDIRHGLQEQWREYIVHNRVHGYCKPVAKGDVLVRDEARPVSRKCGAGRNDNGWYVRVFILDDQDVVEFLWSSDGQNRSCDSVSICTHRTGFSPLDNLPDG